MIRQPRNSLVMARPITPVAPVSRTVGRLDVWLTVSIRRKFTADD
jgi:hypothetical protein